MFLFQFKWWKHTEGPAVSNENNQKTNQTLSTLFQTVLGFSPSGLSSSPSLKINVSLCLEQKVMGSIPAQPLSPGSNFTVGRGLSPSSKFIPVRNTRGSLVVAEWREVLSLVTQEHLRLIYSSFSSVFHPSVPNIIYVTTLPFAVKVIWF